MTNKEYLMQGYRLKNRIAYQKEEIERLRELASSVGSPGFEQHYNPNINTSSPFEKILIKVFDMETECAKMLEELLSFKQELTGVINALEDKDERFVLFYRYIHNMSFADIAERLSVDRSTVKRWHDRAVAHVVLPANPTIIDKFLLRK